MNSNEIYNLPAVPTTDGSAACKKWVGQEIANEYVRFISGFGMFGTIDMRDNPTINLSTPTHDKDAANKKWVEDSFAKKSEVGITQQLADNRYVRKTKLTLAEWSWRYINISSTYTWPFRASACPESVRVDHLTSESNIEIKCITFDNEVTKTQILGATLVFQIRSVSAGDVSNDIQLASVPLAGKTLTTLKSGASTNVYAVHLDEEVYLGSNATLLKSLAYNIGVKATGLSTTPEIIVTYRFNEAGRYG